jgi:O-antigen ligase
MEKAIDYSVKVTTALLIISIPLPPRWSNYALILLGIIGVIIYSRTKSWNGPPLIFYFLIGAYVVRIIWLLRTNDLHNGLKSLETEAPLAAVPLVFSFFKLSEESRKQFLTLYVWTAFLLMAFAFVNLLLYIVQSPLGFFEYLDMHLHNRKQMSEAHMLDWKFGHPSFLSIFVLYAMSILFFVRPKTAPQRFFFMVYVIAGFIFTLFSGSRAGFSLMFLSFLIYIIIECRSFFSKKIPILILMGLLAIGCLLFGDRIWYTGFDSLDPLRTATIGKSMKAFKEKPLLGYGTGGEKEIIRDEHLESIGYSIYHPHNQYLTELLQFGMVGALPFFIFVISAVAYSLKRRQWDLFCIMIVFAVFMIFESPINSNKGLLPFMIAITLISFNDTKTFSLNRNEPFVIK